MPKKVLIIGDTILDKDVYLKAIGLSLESPTIKTSYCGENINFGGAANVARLASRFGLDITFVTYMTSKSEESFLKQNKIKLINLNNKIENLKTRFYINHGDEKYKYLQINNTNNKRHQFNLEENMNKYDIIAFSDYRCGTISKKMILDSIKSSAKTFGASQVSSRESNIEKYQDIDFLVCNKFEATWFSRRKNVIITQGSKGCEINGVNYQSPLIEVPKNTIGAGDCFYAAFLAYEDPIKANQRASEYVQGIIT